MDVVGCGWVGKSISHRPAVTFVTCRCPQLVPAGRGGNITDAWGRMDGNMPKRGLEMLESVGGAHGREE